MSASSNKAPSISLEHKWDMVWPLACSIAHGVETFDRSTEVRDATRLMHLCREMKKLVDYLCPDEGATNV
jgi:hypothetical protein